MTLKRVAALLVAAGLVIGALLLRDAIDNDDSQTATSTTTNSDGRSTLVCDTEFAEVCDQLDTRAVEVTVESAGATLDRLAKADADLPDLWLTLDPFPAMLDDLRSLGSNNLARVVQKADPLAMTDPLLALRNARLESFTAGCAGKAAWACASDTAGDPWTELDPNAAAGSIEVGIRDPSTEAIGLLEFANVVAGHFNADDLDQRPWDQDSAAFTGWLRSFAENVNIVPAPTTPLNTMLTRPAVNVASTSAAETQTSPQSGVTFDTVAVSPEVPINAVLAVIGDEDLQLAAQILAALTADGWDVPAAAASPLTASTFIALRQLWEASS